MPGYRSKYDDLFIAFLQTKTPSEFLNRVVDDVRHIHSSTMIMGLSRLIERYMGQDKAIKFLEKSLNRAEGEFLDLIELQEIAPDNFLAIIEKAHEARLKKTGNAKITAGVFCDVEGTLLIQGALNKPLANYLSCLHEKGVPVTIFTGGDIEKLTRELITRGFSEVLLPIRKKDEFFGHCLEVLIDDTRADYQPFAAENFFLPEEFKSGEPPKLVKIWGASTTQPSTIVSGLQQSPPNL